MTKKAKIFYFTLSDEQRKEEKLEWLKTTPFKEIPFERITPDKNHNWINLAEDNDWERLLPVTLPKLSGKSEEDRNSVFDLASFGVVSNRDEWVYDFSKKNLMCKLTFYVDNYNLYRKKAIRPLADNWYSNFDSTIKWTQDIRQYFENNIEIFFVEKDIVTALYRPFVKKKYYYSKWLNWSLYKMPFIFREEHTNQIICFSGPNSSKPFSSLASDFIGGLDFLEKTQCLPLYRYDKAGNRVENITDWGLEQFRSHYQDENIKKEAIFHYTYAVLHNPAYRQKYELNLKREFPRLPFYPDFWQWVAWGKALMDLHLNYETAKKYPLKRQDLTGLTNLSGLKVKLKADKLAGTIAIDEQTTLHGIPEAAWEYKLGNRSALEWILDQYKEKKPSDPTIAEKFNTYHFADYKEAVIELLQRVCTVSVRTVEIIKQMENE